MFILAGEASGDRIGAHLLGGILQRRPDITVTGVGGDGMMQAGLISLFPMDDLSVMGYRDVVLRLPLLLWRARQVVRHIMRLRPDVVVLIDAQVFSKVVAKHLRRRGYEGRIVLYVAPAVWAWGAERAKTLANIFDEVLSVLPFEPEAMSRLGGPETAYVGHPATHVVTMRSALPEHGLVLLLPGSRRSEIKKHLPMFGEFVERLGQHNLVDGLAILATRAQAEFISNHVDSWPVPVSVITEKHARDAAMDVAICAVAVSGTVTLELALAGVPHVLTYIAEPAQVRIFQNATVPYIGLPNIIAGRPVAPEVLFAGQGRGEALYKSVTDLLDRPDRREQQLAEFTQIRALMEKGAPEAPLKDPVDRVLSHFAAS
ncbi:lipid-A-disaccharide synthase [Pelagibacterium luteolum]|nr:lipid-A-disaccharide synthase [Pelagibacterium luteolum]